MSGRRCIRPLPRGELEDEIIAGSDELFGCDFAGFAECGCMRYGGDPVAPCGPGLVDEVFGHFVLSCLVLPCLGDGDGVSIVIASNAG